jgi:hypothetical protein
MTRTLFSISALAVELGRDRRTIAQALDSVSPDGKIAGGHKGWHLQTVLRALDDEPKTAADPMVGPLGSYLDRVENWRETTGAERPAMDIEEVAAILEKPVATLLIWLRAGCPFHTAGDFETGAGFVLDPARVIDWYVATSTLPRLAGNVEAARRLKVA